MKTLANTYITLPQSRKVPERDTVVRMFHKSTYLIITLAGEKQRHKDINLPKVTSVGNCVAKIHPRESGSSQTLCSNFHTVGSFVQHCLSKEVKSSRISLVESFCRLLLPNSWEIVSNWGTLDARNSG